MTTVTTFRKLTPFGKLFFKTPPQYLHHFLTV